VKERNRPQLYLSVPNNVDRETSAMTDMAIITWSFCEHLEHLTALFSQWLLLMTWHA
jgi:hypothetical protein